MGVGLKVKEKLVAVIYTAFALVQPLKQLFHRLAPDLGLMNIVDDSLLQEVLQAGEVSPRVVRRICGYIMAAEDAGASVIVNSCSSVSEVVDVARPLVHVPVIKIDEPMAAKAVSTGRKIGVAATLRSTLDPTARLVLRKAHEAGKNVQIVPALCHGAFEALLGGDPARHDEIVLGEISRLTETVDVVVLAQGSMARLLPLVKESKVPVLASPELGVMEAVRLLGG